MRVSLWLLALFAAAVAAALFAGSNPGSVTIFWPPYRIDLSLNLVLVVLLLEPGGTVSEEEINDILDASLYVAHTVRARQPPGICRSRGLDHLLDCPRQDLPLDAQDAGIGGECKALADSACLVGYGVPDLLVIEVRP